MAVLPQIPLTQTWVKLPGSSRGGTLEAEGGQHTSTDISAQLHYIAHLLNDGTNFLIVPLDDDDQGLSEFLLVPSPQACIHVPAPPPNQMVMVHMRSGAAPKRSWGPVWIKGRLHIATSDSQYGKISFKIRGDSAERYQMPN